jgi:glutathione S-transferase
MEINPNGQVPSIQEINKDTGDVQFTLFESAAILRYLADKYEVADHWFPRKDIVQRARVNQYLDWHANFIRQGSGQYIFKKLFSEKILGRSYTEEELKVPLALLKKSLL